MIESITFGELAPRHVVGFEVTLHFIETEVDLTADAAPLDRLVRYPRGPYNVVRLTGNFDRRSSILVETLVRSLRSRGLTVHAVTKGDIYHAWLSAVNWSIVELDSPVWPVFSCNEIWYHLDTAESPEPTLPEKRPAWFIAYVVPSPDISQKDLFAWLSKATHPWALLASKPIRRQVWKQER